MTLESDPIQNLYHGSSCITLRPEGGRYLSWWQPKSQRSYWLMTETFQAQLAWTQWRRTEGPERLQLWLLQNRKPHWNGDEGALLGLIELNTSKCAIKAITRTGRNIISSVTCLHNFGNLIILIWLYDIHLALTGNLWMNVEIRLWNTSKALHSKEN